MKKKNFLFINHFFIIDAQRLMQAIEVQDELTNLEYRSDHIFLDLQTPPILILLVLCTAHHHCSCSLALPSCTILQNVPRHPA